MQLSGLEKSSLAPDIKLLRAIDLFLNDEFELCSEFLAYLHDEHPHQVWSSVADELLERLSNSKKVPMQDKFHRKYERNQILNMIILALEYSNRKCEIIPLCEREALSTGDYDLLIDNLVERKGYQTALEWTQKGL